MNSNHKTILISLLLILSIIVFSGCQKQLSSDTPPVTENPEYSPTIITENSEKLPSALTETPETYTANTYISEDTSPNLKIIGKVIRVIDGDTIYIQTDKGQVKIRLSGIDCPEKDQPYGDKATEFAYDKVMDKAITAIANQADVYDRYGRFLGNVIMEDGKSLNEELVAARLAWHYKYYSDDPVLAELEAKAKEGKLGLWADDNPIAPWEWRKMR